MKKLIIAAFCFMTTQLFAQKSSMDNGAYNKPGQGSGYGVLSTQFSRFNGQPAIFAGAYGGWMINHKLMMGLGGYGLVSQHKGMGMNEHTSQPNNWKMGYGGLMVEYYFFGTENIHLTVNTLLGAGIIKNGNGRGTIPENGSDELEDIDASGFYVVQPSLNLEVKATNWFRIGAGIGYRYVTGSDQTGISNSGMSAPTANIAFKFGLF